MVPSARAPRTLKGDQRFGWLVSRVGPCRVVWRILGEWPLPERSHACPNGAPGAGFEWRSCGLVKAVGSRSFGSAGVSGFYHVTACGSGFPRSASGIKSMDCGLTARCIPHGGQGVGRGRGRKCGGVWREIALAGRCGGIFGFLKHSSQGPCIRCLGRHSTGQEHRCEASGCQRRTVCV